MIDSLILSCADKGYSSTIYLCVKYSAIFVQLFCLLFTRKAYGFSIKKVLIIYILIYPILIFGIRVVTWVEYGFQHWSHMNTVRMFVWLPPLFLFYSKLLKIPYGRLADYFAPTFALAFGLVRIGCTFAGCDYGYPCSWGIYNPKLHERLFPLQPLEFICSVLVSVWLFRYAKKHGYECQGKVMALFLILAGFTRFIFEFFRDNTKLFWGISELAIWAFLAFVEGCVLMLVIKKREKNAGLCDHPERI